MANNYQLFSTEIENLSQEEKDWWTKAIDKLENSDEEHEGYVDFQWSFQGENLWIHADESGDVDQVGSLVQEFIQACRPDYIFSFEWANTCSKPRIDEFGGGAAVVTKDDITYITTHGWMCEEVESIKKEREAQHELLL